MILWLHVGSDGLIALSYFSIPAALVLLLSKRKSLVFNWMFMLFAGFIFACGTTHLFGIWTIWNPDYAVEGMIKALTALISSVTALLLWLLIPRAIELPGTKELEEEVNRRKQIEAELLSFQSDLESKVAERTQQLEQFNDIAVGREERMIELKQRINQLCQELGKEPEFDLSFLESNAPQ